MCFDIGDDVALLHGPAETVLDLWETRGGSNVFLIYFDYFFWGGDNKNLDPSTNRALVRDVRHTRLDVVSF